MALIVCYVPDLIILWNRQIESCLQLVFVLQISLLSKNLLCNIFLFLCILFYVYELLTRSNKKFWISFLQMSMKFLRDCLRHKQTRRTYPSSICTWFLIFSSWNWYLHLQTFFFQVWNKVDLEKLKFQEQINGRSYWLVKKNHRFENRNSWSDPVNSLSISYPYPILIL